MDEGMHTGMILIDPEKTFATLKQKILQEKMTFLVSAHPVTK